MLQTLLPVPLSRRPIDPGLAAVLHELRARRARGEEPRSRTSLARALNIRKQAISGWHRVPPNRAIKIAELTGIPVSVLRPDVFPPEDDVFPSENQEPETDLSEADLSEAETGIAEPDAALAEQED